ncbi:PH domain-containing protein [Pseudarthrobacter chlorophenolicus]|uniref:PH domain-containing protein n=1 Tax=Pseudarthrobacter chlorophenolicus TaxID=85085 RepID=UPI0011138A69|nr:PH domain-containing protein [Pseudarthrobacter chlorophenolicus]
MTALRPDIAAARANARFSLGSGRELRQLESVLSADETVSAMTQCRYQGCFGLAVLTDSRFLFLCNGLIWRAYEDISLDRITHVQWHTVFGVGTLTLHLGAVPLEFTGVSGPGGTAAVQGLRQNMAGRDRLDRQVREGILTLAAHFESPAAAPALDSFPDEVPECYFLADSMVPRT